MEASAAQLVERVCPPMPVRQLVLTRPVPLRLVVAEPDRMWIEETQARGGDDTTDMAPADGPSALPLVNQAATTYRISTGPQAGRRVARIGGGVCAPGRDGASRSAPRSPASPCTRRRAAGPMIANGSPGCAATSRGLPLLLATAPERSDARGFPAIETTASVRPVRSGALAADRPQGKLSSEDMRGTGGLYERSLCLQPQSVAQSDGGEGLAQASGAGGAFGGDQPQCTASGDRAGPAVGRCHPRDGGQTPVASGRRVWTRRREQAHPRARYPGSVSVHGSRTGRRADARRARSARPRLGRVWAGRAFRPRYVPTDRLRNTTAPPDYCAVSGSSSAISGPNPVATDPSGQAYLSAYVLRGHRRLA
jgi:hypothetical protein